MLWPNNVFWSFVYFAKTLISSLMHSICYCSSSLILMLRSFNTMNCYSFESNKVLILVFREFISSEYLSSHFVFWRATCKFKFISVARSSLLSFCDYSSFSESLWSPISCEKSNTFFQIFSFSFCLKIAGICCIGP